MSYWDTGFLVLADDLSGAAEAAITVGSPMRVLLHGTADQDAETRADLADLAVDLDCRHLPAAEAAARTRTALDTFSRDGARPSAPQPSGARLAGPPPVATRAVIIKIDSLLRGNIRAHLEAALESTPGPVIFAPALPQQGRTVVDGLPLVDAVPLRDTPAWAIEEGDAPAHLADLCPIPPAHLRLDALRASSGPRPTDSGRLIVADAQTMDDLRTIARIAGELGATLVGSSALARACADVRSETAQAMPGAPSASSSAVRAATTARISSLMVLGTAARRLDGQVAHLLTHADAHLIEVPAEDVQHWLPGSDRFRSTLHRVRGALRSGDVVVRLMDTGVAVDPRTLPDRLAALVDAALPEDRVTDLVATGGETARAVLDRLRVRTLEALAEIHPGAVLSGVVATSARTDPAADGDPRGPRLRYVVTRPGGQGDEDSLTLIHRTLASSRILLSKENA